MLNFQRILDLPSLLEKKSFFLFGPRAVGKSYLIEDQLSEKAQVIDLLNSDLFLRLSQDPHLLEALIQDIDEQPWVVIDEVQKIPTLLDEVHRLIEQKKIHFLLTGSSARKLKRGQANMLAGRAREARMFPLTFGEIQNFISLILVFVIAWLGFSLFPRNQTCMEQHLSILSQWSLKHI